MNRTRLVVAAVATIALLVSAGAAAAAPGQADTAADGDQGPPGDLPGPVPDFVGDVHGAIDEFLSGSIDALGEVVSGLTPGGQPDDA